MQPSHIIKTQRYQSPCGEMVLGSIGGRLCLCDWLEGSHRNQIDMRLRRFLHADMAAGTSGVIEAAMLQLDEYFGGRRQSFDVPLLFAGTDFQQLVWRQLLTIPFAHAISYGELAVRIGRPRAVRAVANASGANAMSIFVPCHRVIGTDRSLTGYGGGMAAKRHLLRLEGVDVVG